MLCHKEGCQLFAGEKLCGVCGLKRMTEKGACVTGPLSWEERSLAFCYTISCLETCTMDPAFLLVSFANKVIFGPGKHD
jgi:hypothetical protein